MVKAIKTVTETAPAQATAPKAPKTPKSAAKAPKAPKSVPAEAKDPSKLGKAQVRILQALDKAGKPLTRGVLASKAGVDATLIGSQAGYANPEINAREVHAGNLVSRKFVKIEKQDVDGKDVITYSLTAAGKKAAQKA